MSLVEVPAGSAVAADSAVSVRENLAELIGVELASAFEKRGYDSLTQVQRAVLRPDARERDLRISSQTGSGKTIAIGLALRDLVADPTARGGKSPRALVIAPTRELARQVQTELEWLYGPLGVRTATLTGGSSYREEHRALSAKPELVVGTPGRILDHVENGVLDLSNTAAIVLDEADRMLDLGFREALDSILERTPDGRRTHLVSATFAPEVLHLADRVQKSPLAVHGTRLGAANSDIDHIVHIVDSRQRFDVLVNVLLANENAKTLVFARTRADVARLTAELSDIGFRTTSLSGEMEQRERNRALHAFVRGECRVLVATDVAARGLDVQDVTMVVHFDPPTDPEDYTHRSGRTGRAGRKGQSVLLIAPREVAGAKRVLARARITARRTPIPTPDAILATRNARCLEELTKEQEGEELPQEALTLAAELSSRPDAVRTMARLLAGSTLLNGPMPRSIEAFERPRGMHHEESRETSRPMSKPMMREPRRVEGAPSTDWTVFHVNWGTRQGADAGRLLAMVCRRGQVERHEVGGIRIGPNGAEVEIAGKAAARFADAASRRDPRDPHVSIRRRAGMDSHA